MKRLLSLFRKRSSRLPKAAVFVDYEHWFFSYRNLLGLRPDINGWLQEIRERFPQAEIMFFADFSEGWLMSEKEKLFQAGVTVFDSAGEFVYRKKDMTDFVMLDAIYQCAHQDDTVDTYVLFTGDGHFQSVVRYLTLQKGKKVVLYGVQDSVSRKLQMLATEVVQLPRTEQLISAYRKMIIEDLAMVMDHPDIIPTFTGTVKAIAYRYRVNPEELQRVLQRMIDQGYVLKKDYAVEYRKMVKILAADWEKLIADGYWDPENQCATGR